MRHRPATIAVAISSRNARIQGAHERQAAEELNQWKAVIDERKFVDATPPASELAGD